MVWLGFLPRITCSWNQGVGWALTWLTEAVAELSPCSCGAEVLFLCWLLTGALSSSRLPTVRSIVLRTPCSPWSASLTLPVSLRPSAPA